MILSCQGKHSSFSVVKWLSLSLWVCRGAPCSSCFRTIWVIKRITWTACSLVNGGRVFGRIGSEVVIPTNTSNYVQSEGFSISCIPAKVCSTNQSKPSWIPSPVIALHDTMDQYLVSNSGPLNWRYYAMSQNRWITPPESFLREEHPRGHTCCRRSEQPLPSVSSPSHRLCWITSSNRICLNSFLQSSNRSTSPLSTTHITASV